MKTPPVNPVHDPNASAATDQPCFDGDWRTLPHGTRWRDPTGQEWRRVNTGRLKVGGSHPNSGPKPQALRLRARQDLAEILHKAKKIALNPKAKARDVLKVIEVLHKVGGMQSVALLNADGDNATLQPIQVVENVVPIPASQVGERLQDDDTPGQLPALYDGEASPDPESA